MEAPPTGASRFHVVFGRSTGSRKQRARHEGFLSVGYHVTTLLDTEANACVMACRGTGAMPNRIFTKMQAARRGASWTVGTELSLNEYDVLIGEVMELHLTPFDETVPPAEGDGIAAAATAAVAVAQRKCRCVRPLPATPCAPHGNVDTRCKSATSGMPPPLPLAATRAATVAAPPSAPRTFRLAVPHAASPFTARTHCPLSDNTALRMAASVRLDEVDLHHADPERTTSDGRVPALPPPLSPPPPQQATSVVATEEKRARLEVDAGAAAPSRGRRSRRSPGSLARELRSSYPQYF